MEIYINDKASLSANQQNQWLSLDADSQWARTKNRHIREQDANESAGKFTNTLHNYNWAWTDCLSSKVLTSFVRTGSVTRDDTSLTRRFNAQDYSAIGSELLNYSLRSVMSSVQCIVSKFGRFWEQRKREWSRCLAVHSVFSDSETQGSILPRTFDP